MTRQSKAERGKLRLAILKRYGLLIDVSGELPLKLPARSTDPQSESFKSWCERVVGCKPDDVVVLSRRTVPPQTQMKSLRATSPTEEVVEMLIAQHGASDEAASRRLTRAKRKADERLAQVEHDEAQLRAARDRFVRRERTSGLDSLAADLEKWVDGNPLLDELVQQRAQSILDGLERGRSVAALIEELLLFAQKCRSELGRSASGLSPQQPRTR